MIGRTDKIRIAFLALKFVLAISKAKAKPKKEVNLKKEKK